MAWLAKRKAWLLAIGLVILHAYSLVLPFVNQETAFNLGAQFFQDGDPIKLARYFELEANTLVLSWLGSVVARLFHIDADSGCRLISLAALFGAGLSFASTLRKSVSAHAVLIISLCIFLNPLVWTYAGRGTADFPPMALALLSISLFWRPDRRPLTTLFAVAIFALAAVVKYHALLLLPFIFWNPNIVDRRARLIDLCTASAVAGFAIVAYNLIVYRQFGFWITPPKFASAHRLSPSDWVSNLIRYGGYLALLAAPFAIASSLRLPIKPIVIVGLIVLAMAVGAILPASTGEMNFGPFDRWLGSWASGSLLAGFCLIFAFSAYERWRAGGLDRSLVLAIILALIVLSATRPAQRYLLLVMPFYYLTLLRVETLRRYAVPTIALFMVLNTAVAILQFKGKPAAVNKSFGVNRQF